MYVDAIFKRCCLCIPLRHGLLTWGYVKLVIMALLIVAFVATYMVTDYHYVNSDMWLAAPLIIIGCLDFIFNVVFVTSAHMKNFKLLKIYYYYSCVIFVALVIMTTCLVERCMNFKNPECKDHCFSAIHSTLMMESVAAIAILYVVLEFYLILLVRNEIFKLQNNRSFIFVDVSASEAACTMSASEKEVQEKVKYDRLEEDAELAGVYNDCQQAI